MRREQGFSLIELMVGLTVGMIIALVVGAVLQVFESQKGTTMASSDAQTDGALAAHYLERDLRMSGYGFNVGAVLGCDVKAMYNNDGVVRHLRLVPAAITNGGADGQSDTIEVVYSNKDSFAVPARMVQAMPNPSANWKLNSIIGMTEPDTGATPPVEGDFLVGLHTATNECALVQVTELGNPGNASDKTTVVHNSGQSDWNPSGASNTNLIFPAAGYAVGDPVFNLGSLAHYRYSVVVDAQGRSNLQRETLDPAGSVLATDILVSNVVNLQAQYGFDTDNDGKVNSWSTTTPTTQAGWQQLRAVRMAVVSRSQKLENAAVTTTQPNWDDGSAAGATLKIDNLPNWQRYRYRVFQTIVPFRNLVWLN